MLTEASKMAEVIPSAICFYSTGRDSTVMLDLMVEAFGPDRLKVVHLYTVPHLSFKIDLFAQLKDRYGIDVIEVPSWEISPLWTVQ